MANKTKTNFDFQSKKTGHRFSEPPNFVESAEISGGCTTARYFERVAQQKCPKIMG